MTCHPWEIMSENTPHLWCSLTHQHQCGIWWKPSHSTQADQVHPSVGDWTQNSTIWSFEILGSWDLLIRNVWASLLLFEAWDNVVDMLQGLKTSTDIQWAIVVTILFPFHSLLLILHSFHLCTWRGNLLIWHMAYLFLGSSHVFSLLTLPIVLDFISLQPPLLWQQVFPYSTVFSPVPFPFLSSHSMVHALPLLLYKPISCKVVAILDLCNTSILSSLPGSLPWLLEAVYFNSCPRKLQASSSTPVLIPLFHCVSKDVGLCKVLYTVTSKTVTIFGTFVVYTM